MFGPIGTSALPFNLSGSCFASSIALAFSIHCTWVEWNMDEFVRKIRANLISSAEPDKRSTIDFASSQLAYVFMVLKVQ